MQNTWLQFVIKIFFCQNTFPIHTRTFLVFQRDLRPILYYQKYVYIHACLYFRSHITISFSKSFPTRWGTWLEVANYFAENWVQIRRIINSFERNGILVRKAKDIVNDEGVTRSLTEIQRDYSNIPKMIRKVESSKYIMLEAYKDITKADFKSDSAGITPYLKKTKKMLM